MKIRRVVPKMEGTFGKIVYAGEGEVETQGYGRNAKVVGREYHLYSSKQRADDIVVKIVGNVAEHDLEYMEEVKLVNPRLIVEGKKAGDNGYSDYMLLADDIERVQ